MKLKLITIGILVLMLSFAISSNALGETENHQFYLMIGGINLSIDSDQLGSIYQREDDTTINVLLPELKSGSGWSVVFGERIDRLVGEVEYQQSSHDGKGVDMHADFQMLGANVKYHLTDPEKALSLYTKFSYAKPLLKIKDAYYEYDSASNLIDTGDAKIKGNTYGLGLGISFKTFSQLYLDGGVTYYRSDLHRVKVDAGTYKPNPSIKVDSYVYNVGLKYVF